jgi:hypothetical protein
VNDVPEMKGYRVRLRVVEEYDVALLARSAVDAKARAEADVRGGEQFEAIQDSWPEEIVSVEALAAEPYPDLEQSPSRCFAPRAVPPSSSYSSHVLNGWRQLITAMNPCKCRPSGDSSVSATRVGGQALRCRFLVWIRHAQDSCERVG